MTPLTAQMERRARRFLNRRAISREFDARERSTKWEDIAELSRLLTELRGPWKPQMDVLRSIGPTMVSGGLMGPVVNPPNASLPTVTGGATELTMFPIGLTPISNNAQSGQVYFIYAGGVGTTAATPGTFTFTPRIGTPPTNASTAILGAATAAFTPTASCTATPFQIQGFVTIRGGGTAANASGSFEFAMATAVASGGPILATATGVFGGITAATYDGTGVTGAPAFWLGVTHATSTTNTWVTQTFAWASLN